MSTYESIDFFNDESLVADPYPYFDELRDAAPVLPLPHLGVVAVTGYDEAVEVYRDPDTFSSCNSVVGPFAMFPVPLEGDDVGDVIDSYRDQLPMFEHMVTMDPPQHTRERALLMKLITPKRLKENEEFIWGLADRQLDEFIADGKCEFIRAYTQPFAMLVVADLLGVPESDHDVFREQLGAKHPERTVGGTGREKGMTHNPLEFLYEQFTTYIEDRRRSPRDDVMTGLATATFPDGSMPEVSDVVRIATNLFAAGQETTVRLFGTALQLVGERPDLQQLLRDDRDRIPNFVEECLRYESPVKGDIRLSRVPTDVGGVALPAGATVMVLNGAANRDPRRYESPHEFDVDRANARTHLSFGHGIHTCPGAPLARAEARVGLERLLDRMSEIRISERAHGPAGARHYEYVPTFILRGVTQLHLEFTPA